MRNSDRGESSIFFGGQGDEERVGVSASDVLCISHACVGAKPFVQKDTIQVATQEWAIEIQSPQFLTKGWFLLKGSIELAQISAEQRFNLRAKRKNGDFLALMVELPCMNTQELLIIYTDAGLDALFLSFINP